VDVIAMLAAGPRPAAGRRHAPATLLWTLLATAIAAATIALPARAGGTPREAAPLLPAMLSSDYATVERLLATRAADPNGVLPDGSTPLSWAAEMQDARLVRLLLAAKARPDAVSNTATAPLLLACEHGDPQVLALLLDSGADVKRTRDDGIAPLALCAGSAPPAIIERLVGAGAPVDQVDAAGQTPLMRAAARGRVENLRLLVARGADVNRVSAGGFTPLFFALKSGNPAAPVAVLEAGGNPDHVGPEGTTAVQLALYQHDTAFAARMVERGADLAARDRNGNTLLHAAVIAGDAGLTKRLLAKGADPNALTGKPRVDWRYEANFKTGDVVMPAKSALLLAAEAGSAPLLELLATAGADASFRLEDGTGLLHAAVASGRADALQVALRLVPDVNAADANGQTALHRLLRADPMPDTPAMLRLLAQAGARADLPNRRGRTAAELAAEAPDAVRASFAAAFPSRASRS
jgi:uncharacterized protein